MLSTGDFCFRTGAEMNRCIVRQVEIGIPKFLIKKRPRFIQIKLFRNINVVPMEINSEHRSAENLFY